MEALQERFPIEREGHAIVADFGVARLLSRTAEVRPTTTKAARESRRRPEWLRIDPTVARLRGTPRFERLVNGS